MNKRPPKKPIFQSLPAFQIWLARFRIRNALQYPQEMKR
jgi:hypothetical protein